jgi:peptidyl-prolyl cis-trans isomerase D
MLQKIGDSLKGKKYFAWIVLVPLVLVFAVWGATGAVSLDFMGPQNYAAIADGNRVEQARANELWQREVSDWQQATGQEPSDEVREQLRDQVLERLIVGELISARGTEFGYRVPDRTVVETIQSEPAFQVDGKYSESLALARLSQVGATPEQYRADIRRDLQNRELQRTIFVSEFATPTEVGRQLALQNEQREVAYAVLPVSRFISEVRLTEAQLQAWFEKNRERYRMPESVKFSYVTLSLTDVTPKVVLADSDLQQYYAENKDLYQVTERRRARHVLVETEAEAQQVLSELKTGADFAALATKRSKDTGSASSGGDLGFSDRSAFVAPFADAVFSMKQGELRGPVKTEFGYHVIRLDEIQAGRSKLFDEVRGEIEQTVRADRAGDLFAEQQERIERQIEAGAKLDKLAAEFGLSSVTVESHSRGAPTPLGVSADLDATLFSDVVLNQRKVGGPVPIGDDQIAFVEVVEHRKSVTPELATVRAAVTTAATRELAEQRAMEFAETLAAKVSANANLASVARTAGVTANAPSIIDRNSVAVPSTLRAAIFNARRPVAGNPVSDTARLDNDSVAVFAITQSRAVPAANDAAVRAMGARAMVAAQGQASLSAYVNDMRDKAKVEKNAQVLQ